MNLIEEIEAAAKRAYETSLTWHLENGRRVYETSDDLMLDLTIDDVWKRIKAALEAAQAFHHMAAPDCGAVSSRYEELSKKFREAMGE